MRQLVTITAVLLLAGLLLPATSASAVTANWIPASGSVSDPLNWNTEAVPTTGDTVYIANSGTATIGAGNTFAGDIGDFNLGNGAGTAGNVTQTGGSVVMGTDAVTTKAAWLRIGYATGIAESDPTCVYDMSGGTLSVPSLVVVGLGGKGKLQLSGGDSENLGASLTATNRLYVGDSHGTGTVEMSGYSNMSTVNMTVGRSYVDNIGSISMTGHANLSLVTSTGYSYVGGVKGKGTMTMDEYSTATVGSARMYVGDGADGVGELTLKGHAQMTVNSGAFRVGSSGGAPTDDGEGNLTDHNAKGTVNIQGGASATDLGAKLTATNGMNVGIFQYGEGYVNVHEYGELYVPTTKTLVVGDMYQTAAAHGYVLADGHGQINTGYMTIGNLTFGIGSGELKDSATLRATNDVTLGTGGGEGTLTLTTPTDPVSRVNGQLDTVQIDGSLYLGNDGIDATDKSIGKLYVNPGTSIRVNGSILAGNADNGVREITMTGGSITTGGWFCLARTGAATSGKLTMRGDSSITAGGLVLISNGYVGTGSSGTATLSDNASFTANGDQFTIAWGGTGTLTVGDGTAPEEGDPGAVVHAGKNILLCNDPDDANATLNINVGGTVETPFINTNNGVSATINLDGGLLKVLADDTPETPFIGNPGGTINKPTFAINVLDDGARVDTNGHNATIDEALVEDAVSTGGGLTKLGEGILTLTKACSYTGDTAVEAGALAVNGSITSNVTVAADAALMGSGTVTGNVTAGAGTSVAPGNSIGTLTVTGDLTLGGTLDVEYDGDTGTIDMLAVSGELDLAGGTLSFSNWGTQPLANGDYVFATYGTLAGAPATEVGLLPGWFVDYAYDYNGGTDNSIALVAVPEPSTFALIAILFGWLAARRRDR